AFNIEHNSRSLACNCYAQCRSRVGCSTNFCQYNHIKPVILFTLFWLCILLSRRCRYLLFCVTTDCVKNINNGIDETIMTIRVVKGLMAVLPCTVSPDLTEKLADQYK
ncbi:hypothetical protein BgiBS90_010168, partial [Biomphalaria glabrata]